MMEGLRRFFAERLAAPPAGAAPPVDVEPAFPFAFVPADEPPPPP